MVEKKNEKINVRTGPANSQCHGTNLTNIRNISTYHGKGKKYLRTKWNLERKKTYRIIKEKRTERSVRVDGSFAGEKGNKRTVPKQIVDYLPPFRSFC